MKSPNKNKNRATVIEKIDDLEKDAVRQKVHDFWFRREIPTLDKILISINDDPADLPHFSRATLHRLLKSMNFEYSKRGRNSAMIEKDEIVIWRNKYLEQIRKYRAEGQTIYYLDETWINAGDVPSKIWDDKTVQSCKDAFLKGLTTGASNPTGKGKRLIVLHIGSEDGFVPGGLLSFESKKNTNDSAIVNCAQNTGKHKITHVNCARVFIKSKKVTCKLRPGKITGKILNSLQPYNLNN